MRARRAPSYAGLGLLCGIGKGHAPPSKKRLGQLGGRFRLDRKGTSSPVVICGGHADNSGGGVGAASPPVDELATGPSGCVGSSEEARAGWMGFLGTLGNSQ